MLDKSKLDPESRRQLEMMELLSDVDLLKEQGKELRSKIDQEIANRKKSDYAVLEKIPEVTFPKPKRGVVASIFNLFK